MRKNQKLDLTCIGKENRPKLEPRILLEDELFREGITEDSPADQNEGGRQS